MFLIFNGTVIYFLFFWRRHFLQDKPKSSWAEQVPLPDSDTPIDCVILWVNGSDPAFIRNISRYSAGKSVDPSRYRDYGTLRFALRSVAMYAPWVRNVYLVTNGQVPYWWNHNNPRAKIVTHEEIYLPEKSSSKTKDLKPDGQLPTFSSCGIETKIRNIPGLSSHFIYLNDDMMLGRPLSVDYFIDKKRNRLRYQHGDFVAPHRISAKLLTWHATIHFSNDLLNKFYKHKKDSLHYYVGHGCYFLSKYVLDRIADIWSDEIIRETQNRFRVGEALAIPFLNMNVAYEEGLATLDQDPKFLGFGQWSSNHNANKVISTDVINSDYKCLCIQDSFSGNQKEIDREIKYLNKVLCKRFPMFSEFENPDIPDRCLSY